MKQENISLNILKGIACICVVTLHCSFPGIAGKVLYGLARFAVPLFFAISGYFVYNSDNEKVKRQLRLKIIHILNLFAITEVLYLVFHLVKACIEYEQISGAIIWIKDSFTVNNIGLFIIFQKTIIGDISWFLVALIMCYLVTYIVSEFSLWKKTCYLIPVLLIINVCLGEISPLIWHNNVNWYWISNFWLLGFPCYALGYFIRIYKNKFIEISTNRVILMMIGSILLNLLERIGTKGSQFFISNIPFMVGGLILCLKYPIPTRRFSILRFIGKELSFGVYIVHPIIRDIYKLIFKRIGIIEMPLISWLVPMLTIVTSIVAVYVVVSCWKKRMNYITRR